MGTLEIIEERPDVREILAISIFENRGLSKVEGGLIACSV